MTDKCAHTHTNTHTHTEIRTHLNYVPSTETTLTTESRLVWNEAPKNRDSGNQDCTVLSSHFSELIQLNPETVSKIMRVFKLGGGGRKQKNCAATLCCNWTWASTSYAQGDKSLLHIKDSCKSLRRRYWMAVLLWYTDIICFIPNRRRSRVTGGEEEGWGISTKYPSH